MPVYGLNKQQWLSILAAWAGWLMDGYTTIAYALVAVTISKIFFPTTIGILGLIATFGGFATEALARPVGALIFGNFIGDKLGRRNMLTLTILGFSLLAASKSILPSYSQIGLFSPILLYIVLFFEGMFAGAEYGGGTTLALESIPAERRAFIGSFVQSGFGTGYFIIALVYSALYTIYGNNFGIIGWRVLFATCIIPGLLTLLVRLITKETPVFDEMKRRREVLKVPIKDLFKSSYLQVIAGLMITSGLLYINTATFSFYPTVMTTERIPGSLVGLGVAIINLISLFGVWIGGLLADLIGGRKRPMLIYSLIFIVLTYPILYLGLTNNFAIATTVFSIQAFLEAMIFATLPSFLAEQFSKKYRTTGVGFTYNGGAIVGGFAISIILTLSTIMGLLNSWFINILLAGVIMIIGISLSKETYTGKEDPINR
ncbi:MFS transporter [Saccharolobus islandicus]|uniref:Permeases of the major facilitator superfamily n=1 Tax=Saccharolobus islandicus LAL14/1 TaxID=1241935 RepID=M9UD29_SACIS|nr:MFS transporter [Sulfolobus islandicus]AGJ62100.1 Permeases of the major facilitator superfamily [Sulfolobus islandicus LAL14/1]